MQRAFSMELVTPEIRAISISKMTRRLKGASSFSPSRRLQFTHCKALDSDWAEVMKPCKERIQPDCHPPQAELWPDTRLTGSSNSLLIIPPPRSLLPTAS